MNRIANKPTGGAPSKHLDRRLVRHLDGGRAGHLGRGLCQLLLAWALCLGAANVPAQQTLADEVAQMRELAESLTSQMQQLKSDMDAFNEASVLRRTGEGTELSSDTLVQNLENLKETMYTILEETDLNNDFMDSVEATISEVKLRRDRAQRFSGPEREDLMANWEAQLTSLERQKGGITRARDQARNSLAMLREKEALVLEYADLQQIGAITAQLEDLYSQLQQLSETMSDVATTSDPQAAGQAVPSQ